MRITARMREAGQTTAETVYNGESLQSVSAPGGIALDNFFVYWLNKNSGTKVGSLLRGRQEPGKLNATADAVKSLASNAQKCYGVCLALGNIFFTDETNSLYGVRRAATGLGDTVTISSTFQEPRGCAFDGDSTVYVADKVGNAVYQFPSNMQELS